MSSQIPINLKVVLKNVETLSTFEVGDKPVSDSRTGSITKEKRSWFVDFRRSVWGGFEPSVLERTLIKINELVNPYQFQVITEDEDLYLEKHPDTVTQLKDAYPDLLKRIENIKGTYVNEANYESTRWKRINNLKSKQEMIDKLGVILKKYQSLDEKKKLKNAVFRSHKRAKKKAVTHHEFISDLQCSFLKGLRKTGTTKKAKNDNHLERSFNLKMLTRTNTPEKKDEVSSDSEWSDEEEIVFNTFVPEKKVPVHKFEPVKKTERKIIFNFKKRDDLVNAVMMKRRKSMRVKE